MSLQSCSPGFSVLSTKEPLGYCKSASQKASSNWKVMSAGLNTSCPVHLEEQHVNSKHLKLLTCLQQQKLRKVPYLPSPWCALQIPRLLNIAHDARAAPPQSSPDELGTTVLKTCPACQLDASLLQQGSQALHVLGARSRQVHGSAG